MVGFPVYLICGLVFAGGVARCGNTAQFFGKPNELALGHAQRQFGKMEEISGLD